MGDGTTSLDGSSGEGDIIDASISSSSQDGDSSTSLPPPDDAGDSPPADEICNGLDDDGDGMVDEDQPMVTCGVGSCEVTEPSCVGGMPQECTPALPGAEVCNGLDDDCNGMADDVQQACSTACGDGILVCMGNDEACDAPTPQPESCNVLDDDCDGSFDEGLNGCRVGVHRSFNPATGVRFYTTDLDEAQCCGFVVEAADYYRLYTGPHAGLVPFYRCIPISGTHLYTQDPGCEGAPVNEGAMGYIATAEGTAGAVPLYRVYLPDGFHLYTTNIVERDQAIAVYGFVDEGVAGYVW